MNTDYLWQKLGRELQQGLLDADVVELMLNPDGQLWFQHKHRGNYLVGTLTPDTANGFVHALAQYDHQYLNHQKPYLDATLPFNGERINVIVPPITDAVSFNIRKKAPVIFTLDDYVTSDVLTPDQALLLKDAIADRRNILISGGPGAGKTTFANALLDTMAKIVPQGHRVLLLEQVAELQCAVPNVKRLQVSEQISMRDLLWLCLRNSPDRIVVGEVRDGAALDLLKAWNTGCQGGVATIHANSAQAALQRVLDLSCEVSLQPPIALAAEALDMVVHIEACAKLPAKRRVTRIITVIGCDRRTGELLTETVA